MIFYRKERLKKALFFMLKNFTFEQQCDII